MRRRLLAIVAILVVFSACDDPAPRSSDSSPATTGEAPLSTHSECEREEEVAADISQRMPPTLVEDVDGDGTEERVSIHIDPEGDPRCLAFLLVEMEDLRSSSLLDTELDPDPMFFGRLIGAAMIDERPGTDLVVQVAAGASTQFAALFTWNGEALVPYEVEGGDNLWAFGGSAGHVDAVDCTASGLIRTVSAVKVGERFDLKRRFYRFDGLALVHLKGRAEDLRVTEDELVALPEFRAGPFASCSV